MSQSPDPQSGSSTDDESSDSQSITQAVSTATQKVIGETDAANAAGVLGRTTDGSTVTYGVVGTTNTNEFDGAGVIGESDATNGVRGTTGADSANGVYGRATSTSGRSHGVRGDTESSHVLASGVKGFANSSSGIGAGVWGETSSSDDGAAAVRGEATAISGAVYGVEGRAHTPDSAGVYGTNTDDGPAVEADGHVSIAQRGLRAHLGTQQTVSEGVSIVAFDTVDHDDFAGELDTSTGIYTVPRDGDYHVETNVRWSGRLPGGMFHNIGIRVNGDNEAFLRQEIPGTSNSYVTDHLCTTLFGLSSGDTISVIVQHDSGTDRNIVDIPDGTYLSIQKVG